MNAFIERIEKRLEYIREQRRSAHCDLLHKIFQDEIDCLETVIYQYIWDKEIAGE